MEASRAALKDSSSSSLNNQAHQALLSELESTIAQKKETSKPDRGILTLENKVLNQHGQAVIEVQEVVMIKRGEA